ncbi:MAG: hypothetical protein ACM3ME_08625 [Chloroflexota bacterium]
MSKHLKGVILGTLGFAIVIFLSQLLRDISLHEAIIQSVMSAILWGIFVYFFTRKKPYKE